MSKKDRFKKNSRIDRLKNFPDTPFAGENVTDDEIYGLLAEMKKHFSPEDGAALEDAIKLFKTGNIEEKQKGLDKIVNFTSYVAIKAHKHGMPNSELLQTAADIVNVKTEGDKYLEFRREFTKEDTRVGTIIFVAPTEDQYGLPIIVEFPGEFQIMTSVNNSNMLSKDNLVSQGKILQSGATVEVTGMVTKGVDVNINDKHYQLPYMKSSKICIK